MPWVRMWRVCKVAEEEGGIFFSVIITAGWEDFRSVQLF